MIEYSRVILGATASDPLIARYADETGSLVVTWDTDFRTLMPRRPADNVLRFRKAGHILFTCDYPFGLPRLEATYEMLTWEIGRSAKLPDPRVLVEITAKGFLIER